jgi:hypothetical protein
VTLIADFIEAGSGTTPIAHLRIIQPIRASGESHALCVTSKISNGFHRQRTAAHVVGACRLIFAATGVCPAVCRR